MARKNKPGYDFRSSDFNSQPGRWQQQGRGGTPETAETGDPCACGIHCAERDHEGNAKRCPRPFCDTDTKRIADAIAGLPKTYAMLRIHLTPSAQPAERVSGSRQAPVPVDLQVEAFMREIVHVAVSWEEQVRAVARLSDYPDGPRRDAVALASACKTLHAHLNTLLVLAPEDKARCIPRSRLDEVTAGGGAITLDAAGDAWTYKTLGGTGAGLEFLALNRRAGGMLGLGLERRRITEVPCDQCGNRTLVQRGAKGGGLEPRVSCTNCPNAYIGNRFELLIGRVYSEQVKALRNAS